MPTSREYNTTTPYLDPTDPRTIDWAARQAHALVPFHVVDGLPVNPITPDAPEGRGGLWHWGEAVAADSLVFGRDHTSTPRLLMVERGDGSGWALPGGMLDPGETPRTAAVRELAEETGLTLDPAAFTPLTARGVPDPRAGRNAWIVTVPHTVILRPGTLPAVTGMDDAKSAAWLPARWSLLVLATLGHLFPAHTDLLRDVLPS